MVTRNINHAERRVSLKEYGMPIAHPRIFAILLCALAALSAARVVTALVR